ncbi:MAG: carboxymuconolactone decarboxylase family protein [candidate division NC10 bacterium]|nr:carboxymuconolactone decarboxylase family protein [candidate division NC10 bacterium]
MAHSAAGKLQGFDDEQVWYEVAHVAGVTHGLNAIADGLRLPLDFSPSPRVAALAIVEDGAVEPEVKSVFQEIREFYATASAPAVFRYLARDPGFLQSYWAATREAFSDRKLDRLTKEVLALAASVTAKSDYGVDFHLREVRRLGLSERGVTEALEVVQCFNTVTKIADTLLLEPDFPGPRQR